MCRTPSAVCISGITIPPNAASPSPSKASKARPSFDVWQPPPIAPGGGNAWHIGCHFAFMAILAAVNYRDMTGEGQYIDASIHEACALTTEAAVPIYIYTGQAVRRHTGRAAAPDKTEPTQFATGDGGWLN